MTRDELAELITYDPETGQFHWRATGRVAGCRRYDGRIVIRVRGKLYHASRLAWFLHFGVWPRDAIDHIDGDCSNNRAGNLRDVTLPTNNENIRRHRPSNRLKTLGVYQHKWSSRFSAALGVNGKTIYLGTYDSVEEASAAYVAAKRQHHKGCTL